MEGPTEGEGPAVQASGDETRTNVPHPIPDEVFGEEPRASARPDTRFDEGQTDRGDATQGRGDRPDNQATPDQRQLGERMKVSKTQVKASGRQHCSR